jgi:negative regulator of replication initiation
MPESDPPSPLDRLSESESEIMRRLLKMRPEQQKEASAPLTPKGKAQRERRAKERHAPTATTSYN